MSIEIVENRLDGLLNNDRPKVILLTGGWGAGKTHQWKEALNRHANSGESLRYAYVSIFGLTSLGEVRKRLTEEVIAGTKLGRTNETFGEEVEKAGWKIGPGQILKLLPAIPYLGKLEGLANELSFLAVKDAVICFDDLERGGSGLRLADIFGLASFLKEERKCRVILISNQEKLDADGKRDFITYQEKVADEIINFAPTPDEACEIALANVPERINVAVRERICALGISNIRVINRLSSLVAEFAALVNGMHERVFQEGVQSLILFGVAHFLPSDDFPSVAYLYDLENEWARYFNSAKAESSKTDKDKKLDKWAAIVERYGYVETTSFDVELASTVQRGFFDSKKVVALGQELSDSYNSQDQRSQFHDSWTKFWHSLKGTSTEILPELQAVTLRSVGALGPNDLYPAIQVFTEAGEGKFATELIDAFISSNQERPKIFDCVDGAFGHTYQGEFADRLRAEREKHKMKSSLDEALDRIDFESGWNSDDIRIVGKATSDQIESLLRECEGKTFRIRMRTLLRIGSLVDATEDDKRVSMLTVELLRKLAKEDPLMGIRMRQYIPPDAPAQ